MLVPSRKGEVAIAMVISLALSAAYAESQAGSSPERPTILIPFHSRDSGSFITSGTPIDTDRDGRAADLVLTSGASDPLGAITTQSVLEWTIFFRAAVCPSGAFGDAARLVTGAFVTRAEGGDLLRGSFDSGTMCFDASTNSSTINLVGTIVGGTGRFTGATGTVTVSGVATPLIPSLANPADQQFGSVVLQTEGTIVVGPICDGPPCPL